MGKPEKLITESESPDRERIEDVLGTDESPEANRILHLIPPHDYREPEMFPQFEVKQVSPLPETAPPDTRMGYSFETKQEARTYIEQLTEKGFKGTLQLYHWSSSTSNGIKLGGSQEEIVIV